MTNKELSQLLSVYRGLAFYRLVTFRDGATCSARHSGWRVFSGFVRSDTHLHKQNTAAHAHRTQDTEHAKAGGGGREMREEAG